MTTMRCSRRAGAAVAITLALATACAERDSAPGERIVIALPASNLLAAATFAAEDLDLFSREGLAVDVRTIVGVGAANAVVAGSAEFTIGTAATFLRAVGQGQDLLAIANLVDRPLVELVLRREVADRLHAAEATTLEQRGRLLQGLTIGIQGVGSFVHAWTRYVADAGGLDVDRDLRVAPMDPPAMVTALQEGTIDGFATSPPYTTAVVRGGDAVMLVSGIADAPDLHPFAYGLVYGRRATCAERAQLCARVARAFAAASRTIRDDPELVFERVIRSRFATMEPGLLRAAWQRAREAHTADVHMTAEQFANAAKVNAGAHLPQSGSMPSNYDALYTNEFLR